MNSLKDAPIVRVYAQTLWHKLAESSKSERQRFASGAEKLRSFLLENQELFLHLNSVSVNSEVRRELMINLCLDYKLPPLFVDFVGFLTNQRRLRILPELLRICMRFYREAQGLLGVDLFSSRTLSALQKQELRGFLQAKLAKEIVILSEQKLASGYGILVKLESGGVWDWTTGRALRDLGKRWREADFRAK